MLKYLFPPSSKIFQCLNFQLYWGGKIYDSKEHILSKLLKKYLNTFMVLKEIFLINLNWNIQILRISTVSNPELHNVGKTLNWL